MKKEQLNGVKAQGAENTEKVEVTLDVVKKWLRHDLGAAISCLNAIQTDPALMDAVAEFMYGRFINSVNKQENLFKDEK